MNTTTHPTTLHRFTRFNLVGAIGMAVQLTTLAILHRAMPHHNLIATFLVTELTLLHNFLWHWNYTWRDRRPTAPLTQLLRFHLSNGLVSLTGNVALVRLLTHTTHLPLLADTLIAIASCSLANFLLSHHWTFHTPLPMSAKIATLAALILLTHTAAHAQTQHQATPTSSAVVLTMSTATGKDSDAASVTQTAGSTSTTSAPLPNAPKPQPTWQPHPYDSYRYNVGAFCGIGASTSPIATVPTTGCGAGITFMPYPIFLEFGLMAPQANRSYLSAYMSVDTSIPLFRTHVKYLPMAIVGYSRLFETGHSLDYGLALALPRPGKPKDPSSSLRLELRDYYTFANPTQHNMMLRIGWMSEVSD